MANEPHISPMFRIDVSADPSAGDSSSDFSSDQVIVALLRQLVSGQERQSKLLEEIGQQLSAAQRQRAAELGQWKESNPDLSRRCRIASETLARVQAQFLRNLTDEIYENEDALVDGDFMLNEFVDRFGPRLAHLNGVLQVLSQLSTVAVAANAQ